ncbi:hypothetical protein [Aureimonas sp. SK2]|uniref:hypothetical protein n=1 Tax=Aureimonas sp. SK2 TaxID=3015992 RepID=UPI0024439214|nr:hypothetical protein [Aureimonas sp. SK2]
MTITRGAGLILALAMLAGDGAASGAAAQSAIGRDLSLRERLIEQRDNARRREGERRLDGPAASVNDRRRLLLRQRDSAVGSQRSEPILPRTSRSSVVVTQ